MNILFFLTPKSEVAYIKDSYTVEQALKKMEYHRYSAIPIIDKSGCYIGTLTEGDLLWGLREVGKENEDKVMGQNILTIPRRMDNKAVRISADMEEVVLQAMKQNFVPVVDDQNSFIGIVTRKDLINFFYKNYLQKIQQVI